MYYLKYRPQTIKELDSESIRKRLTSILNADNIPHAFLFAGPKGTGKTSTARIVAKVLNTEENKKKISTLEPAADDENVKAITQGTSPDVIEMDAASNRKIDDIRDLIAELKFAPISSRYKVYIIDEVHMLTKEAFNALLKSLEEPPASTVFILATTEVDTLPKTIISRCVRVNFVKAGKEDVRSMIERIEKGEDITIDSDAKEFIARHADGSFRDATKILELAVIEGDTSVDGIKKVIGHGANAENLLTIISNGKLNETIQWTEDAKNNGADTKILIESLLNLLHLELLKKNKIAVEDETEYNLTIKDIARLIQLLQTAHNQLRMSPIEVLPLEIALVKYFEK